jgi:hypothetical protein
MNGHYCGGNAFSGRKRHKKCEDMQRREGRVSHYPRQGSLVVAFSAENRVHPRVKPEGRHFPENALGARKATFCDGHHTLPDGDPLGSPSAAVPGSTSPTPAARPNERDRGSVRLKIPLRTAGGSTYSSRRIQRDVLVPNLIGYLR